MKLFIAGDPHGKLPKNIKSLLKNYNPDLIICTGDLGKADLARKKAFNDIKRREKGLEVLEDTSYEIKKIYNEVHYSSLDVLKKFSSELVVYIIEGNLRISTKSEVKELENKYNLDLDSTREKLKSIKNVKLVKNQVRNINGLKIGFLDYFIDNSWIKEFNEKDKEKIRDARKETKKAKNILNRFGKSKIDILVCHQPPYGILDKVNFPGVPKNWKGKHAGSKTILDFVKKYKPRYVFCGHIHEAKGKNKLGKTTIINAGCCGDYFIIDIEKDKIIKSNFIK